MPRLAIAVLGGMLLAFPASADPPAKEPALCEQVIASATPGTAPLTALAAAESARWKVARKAERDARKRMRQMVGIGAAAQARRGASEVDNLNGRFATAVYEARLLCGCRQQRGDPYREDCARLYQRWIPHGGER